MALNFKGNYLIDRSNVLYFLATGEVLVSLPNDGYGLDDAVIQKLHMLAYSIFSSTRTAIANYDPSENLQLARVRMKDDELIIYRGNIYIH